MRIIPLSQKSIQIGCCLTLAIASVPVHGQTGPWGPTNALCSAIHNNDADGVKKILVADPRLANSSAKPGYPLSIALSEAKPGMVQLLLDNGADPNQEMNLNQPLARALFSPSEAWRSMAESLLAKGANIEAVDNGGATLLIRLISLNRPDANERVQFLLEKGADTLGHNHIGKPAFSEAIDYGTPEIAHLVLDHTDLKGTDLDGNTPLMVASYRANVRLMKYLLDKGTDVNARNVAGDSCLHILAPIGGPALDLLLDVGADPNIRDNAGELPLHLALRRSIRRDANPYGVVPTLKGLYDNDNLGSIAFRGKDLARLIEKTNLDKMDPNGFYPLGIAVVNRDATSRDLIHVRQGKVDAMTQLCDAVSRDDTTGVEKLLIEQPALIASHFPDGNTALHVAANWHSVGATRLLIERGADVNARNSRGLTPLLTDLAAPKQSGAEALKAIAKLLLAAGANAAAMDTDSASALHRAVYARDADVVNALLDKGAPVDDRDREGKTSLMLTVKSTESDEDVASSRDIVRTLLSRGANPDRQDYGGNSVLARAVAARRMDIIQLLMVRHADFSTVNAMGRGLTGQLLADFAGPMSAATRDTLNLVLENGAEPNEREFRNSSTLIERILGAPNAGTPEILQMLVKSKKFKAKSPDNSSLLFTAMRVNRRDLFEILIAAGADATVKDSSGHSLLEVAKSSSGGAAWVDYLKTKGLKED